MTVNCLRTSAVALITALFTLSVMSAPAQADPDRLRVSINSTAQLFSGSYVPGTVTSPVFTISNDSPSRTLATIELIRVTPPGNLAPALSFSATVGGESPETKVVPLVATSSGQGNSQCLVIGSAYLAPRQTTDARVSMLMADSAGMGNTARFAFRVTLYQVANKGKIDTCPGKSKGASTQVLGSQAKAASFTPTSSDSPQPSTSPRSDAFVYGLAAGVLAAGALLMAGNRRRRLRLS